MIMNKKSLVAIALLTVSALSSAQSVYPGQHLGKMKKRDSSSCAGTEL